MPHEEQVVEIRIPRAVSALEDFLTERGLSYSTFATELGVTGAAVHNWRKGRPPSVELQEAIEMFCAIVDPVTGKAVKNPDTGHWISRCPREWWRLEGEPGPRAVEPYDARFVGRTESVGAR